MVGGRTVQQWILQIWCVYRVSPRFHSCVQRTVLWLTHLLWWLRMLCCNALIECCGSIDCPGFHLRAEHWKQGRKCQEGYVDKLFCQLHRYNAQCWWCAFRYYGSEVAKSVCVFVALKMYLTGHHLSRCLAGRVWPVQETGLEEPHPSLVDWPTKSKLEDWQVRKRWHVEESRVLERIEDNAIQEERLILVEGLW